MHSTSVFVHEPTAASRLFFCRSSPTGARQSLDDNAPLPRARWARLCWRTPSCINHTRYFATLTTADSLVVLRKLIVRLYIMPPRFPSSGAVIDNSCQVQIVSLEVEAFRCQLYPSGRKEKAPRVDKYALHHQLVDSLFRFRRQPSWSGEVFGWWRKSLAGALIFVHGD